MTVLANLEHEKFCKLACQRIMAGDTRAHAITAAYREAVYKGDRPDDKAIAANARRLADRRDIKSRLADMVERASILVDLDQFWAQLKLKSYVDSKSASYRDRIAAIALMAKIAGWEAPTKAEHTGKDGAPLVPMNIKIIRFTDAPGDRSDAAA